MMLWFWITRPCLTYHIGFLILNLSLKLCYVLSLKCSCNGRPTVKFSQGENWRCMGLPLCFSVIFTKGNNFCDFPFAFPANNSLPKCILLLQENSFFWKSKFFPLRVDLLENFHWHVISLHSKIHSPSSLLLPFTMLDSCYVMYNFVKKIKFVPFMMLICLLVYHLSLLDKLLQIDCS